ncbi:MAG: L,D-transpeptidase [Puniceicoccales bacterium]|nr:L,D-transpeptidase [Puniceicoccales bacterium]
MLKCLERKRDELRLEAREDCLCISVGEQKLWHFRANRILSTHTISSSRAPTSHLPGSLGTPTGLHRIAERIGGDAPTGTVFKARRPLGYAWQDAPEPLRAENLITSRILWLDGLEEGKNRGPGCDTHARHIYIHGTNQEDKIGTRNSHGCILLRNADMVALFDAVPPDTLVWIND